MSQDLVLITGGSSGIGKQLAADYLARGALVVIVADQVERLAAAEASLRKVSASVFSVACDIGDRQAVLHMSEVVTQTYGCPDILINNAGFATYRTFEASSSDELERLIEVNLLGAMRCTKAFLPQMIARRHGAIANMASIAGRVVITPNGVYSAAKHAMIAWSEALRHELGRFNIRVSAVCPGRVETAFFEHPTFRERARGPEARSAVSIRDVSRATMRAVARGHAITYVPRTLALGVWLANVAPFLVRPILSRINARRVEASLLPVIRA